MIHGIDRFVLMKLQEFLHVREAAFGAICVLWGWAVIMLL
jgi:hypothetical protein